MEENKFNLERTTIKITSTSDDPPTPEVYQPSFYDVWPQILASCISLSAVVQAGINMSFSGVLLPQLAEDPNIKHFTKVEASWIASLAVISSPVGSLVAGPLMDYFGRKKICIFQNIPLIISWITIYFTTSSLWAIYIARVLSGFGCGLTVIGLIYTAEVAHVRYRAMLLALNSVNVALGILITTIIGVHLDWHTCAFCFGFLSVASLILSLFLPESPYWTASFTDTNQEEIKKIVRTLNNNNKIYEEEWKRIQDAVRKRREVTEEDASCGKKLLSSCKKFGKRGAYMPMVLLLAVFVFQQFSGPYVVIFYTLNIFKMVSQNLGYGFDEYTATMMFGCLRFFMSLVSVGLSRIIGRRPIMMVSTSLMAISALSSGAFLYLNKIEYINFGSKNVTAPALELESSVVSNWWIVCSILLYVCSCSIGIMVIPWTLVGEVLPISVRAVGSGIMISYGSLLLFLIIKTFPFLVDIVTLPGMFFNYAVMSALCTIFIYLYLPETFGKSFDQISKYFEVKKTVNE